MDNTENRISYEIKCHIGDLGSPTPKGWKRELNIVSWNGKPPRYDLRDWSPDHDRMLKGLTFGKNEARQLCSLLIGQGLAETENTEVGD